MLRHQEIVLRPLTDNDKEELAQLANNKNVWDNLRDMMPFPYTVENAAFFINMTRGEKPPVTFAIEFDGQFCGVIGLVPQQDVYNRTAEIGFWIGEPFWNKGIATGAVKLITEYGFTELNLVRIHTGVFEYNIASMKVLEKCGYRKDGVFKKAVTKNEKIWDEHRYGKIK